MAAKKKKRPVKKSAIEEVQPGTLVAGGAMQYIFEKTPAGPLPYHAHVVPSSVHVGRGLRRR
jgi:hypothetical protein